MNDETLIPEEKPDAGATETPAGEDKPDPDAAAVAAFDKGVAEAKAEEAPAVEKPAADAAAATTDDAAEPEAAPAKPETDPVKVAEAEKAAAVEKEIGELGLKEKTAERFRELAKRPTVEQVEAQLAPLREREAEADRYLQVVKDVGATPEQVSGVFGYLKAINSGDPGAMNKAFDAMAAEQAWLAKQLGREVPGVVDPLKEHKDLADEVEVGDITRARALEIAQQRAVSKRQTENAERQSRQTQGQREFEETATAAVGVINAFGHRMKAADPAFTQKVAMLQPAIDLIKARLPPQEWPQAIEAAYAKLPAIAAPAVKAPPVSTMPLRPTGSAAGKERKPKTDMEAFEMGVATVR